MSNETLVGPSNVGPDLEGRWSDEMSRKGTVLMLLKPHHEHRPPCQVGIKRDLGTVASIGGTCVSLSRTRSLEVDDELPGPSLCPLPCHPWGLPCASSYRGSEWWQPHSRLPVEEGRGAHPTSKGNVHGVLLDT